MLQLPLYFDYSATTPCDPRVAEAMMPYFTKYFGNPSSRSHSFGWQAEAAVDQARQSVAALVGASAQEMVFTSGATEACNLALRGVFEMYAVKGNHIITTKTEHKAVLDTCRYLEKKGAEITWLGVSEKGIIDLNELEAAIRPTTILIAIMTANNETGVLMPVNAIGAVARKHDVLFFTDATQAVGKIPVNVNESNASLLAFSAHKLYGPKGVGALYIRRKGPRVKLTPQITGGGQEGDQRNGTLNVPGIVGFGKAAEICMSEMETESQRLAGLRDGLQQSLLEVEAAFLNGNSAARLPQVLNISFKYLKSSQLLSALNPSMAVSSGSACTSGSSDPSYVLKAMGIADDLARGALRFSLGRFTTQEEVHFAAAEVKKVVYQLRSESFEWQLNQK